MEFIAGVMFALFVGFMVKKVLDKKAEKNDSKAGGSGGSKTNTHLK